MKTIKERPLIISTQLIPATLEGRKTQTRRTRGLNVINQAPNNWILEWVNPNTSIATFARRDVGKFVVVKCPYGQVGDRLWVKEKHYILPKFYHIGHEAIYATNNDTAFRKFRKWYCTPITWKSPRFMPRWASRITLEITGIRVERLQEITREDVLAEGISWQDYKQDYKWAFAKLWNSINAKWKRVYNRELKIYEFWQFPWSEETAKPIPKNAKHPERYHCVPNPWVWVIEFKKLKEV